MSWDMRLDDWKKLCALQNTKNTQKAEPMICDDCFHNTVCRLDGNEMLEWCSARVPSANVVEVKHGKNLNDEFYDTDQFICSECGLHLQDWEKIIGDGEIEEFEFKFCPNCGADMRERKEIK